MILLFVLVGLAALLFGANFFVAAAMNLARRFRISEFVIGLTLVSLGACIPETVIAITGGLYRHENIGVSDLIVGQIIGSNVSQIGLILGLAGLLGVMNLKTKALFYQAIFLIGSPIILLIFGQDLLISQAEGLLLVLAYLCYLIPMTISARDEQKKQIVKGSLITDLAKGIIGLIAVIYGARLTLDHSLLLAQEFGVNQSLVGIFLLGLGTSLPELSVALTAFIKKANNVSVGAIFGSYILDALLALGLGASISGFKVDPAMLQFDFPFLIFLAVVVVLFFYSRKKLERKESLLILGLYAGYVVLKVVTSL